MLSRKTPMKRTGFKRKQTDAFKTTFHTQTLMRKAAIKTKKKRVTVAEGAKYLAACRNEPCYLRVPGVCRLHPMDDTVVPCHSNQSRHGKAGGLNRWIDQNRVGTPRQVKFDVWDAGYEMWVPVRARKMGLELQEEV
jgi:hypothetical protein